MTPSSICTLEQSLDMLQPDCAGGPLMGRHFYYAAAYMDARVASWANIQRQLAKFAAEYHANRAKREGT